MDLLALADFNLVARHGSFGEAARATERPKATLSRRVSELESSLGLRLFERGPRGLKLTQEGRALYERTGALLTELAESAAAIASGSEEPRGRLRISAPVLFGQRGLGRIAADYALSSLYLDPSRTPVIGRLTAAIGIDDRVSMALLASPPELILRVLDRARQKADSIPGYLINHGVTDADLARLRAALVTQR